MMARSLGRPHLGGKFLNTERIVGLFFGWNSAGADIWRPGSWGSPREPKSCEVRCILHHSPPECDGTQNI